MRKGAVKAIVLIIIFIVGLVVFSAMTNHVNEDLTTEMEEATLPVITLFRDETEINELHGYRTEMNAAYMRDTITPIGEDRKLPITIQSYQTTVDAVSYEIRSLDGTRLIANADVNSYEDNKGIISAELEIQNLLKEDEEYLLIIMLESGNEQIYYYTRLVEAPESHVEESIAFVKDFNNKTFNSETVGTLSTYMEKTTGDNSTLQFVSLNSSLKQVSWANLPVERLTAPVPSIKEITDTYNVIVLNYVVTSTGESGENEYYNVEEYYRIRYTSSRMYLLNFERTTNQIFRRESAAFYDNDIQLGIRSSDVEYRANEAGTMVAFVQEGELWSYNETENTLAKVFSFRGYEGIDERENYGEHDIKIVSIDLSVLLIFFPSFPDDFFQQMSRLFGAVAVRMNPRLFNVVKIIIYKVLADLTKPRFQLTIAVIDLFQLFPRYFGFFKIFIPQIVFLKKTLFVYHCTAFSFSFRQEHIRRICLHVHSVVVQIGIYKRRKHAILVYHRFHDFSS